MLPAQGAGVCPRIPRCAAALSQSQLVSSRIKEKLRDSEVFQTPSINFGSQGSQNLPEFMTHFSFKRLIFFFPRMTQFLNVFLAKGHPVLWYGDGSGSRGSAGTRSRSSPLRVLRRLQRSPRQSRNQEGCSAELQTSHAFRKTRKDSAWSCWQSQHLRGHAIEKVLCPQAGV